MTTSPPKSHPHGSLLLARIALEEGRFEDAFALLEPEIPNTDSIIMETYAEALFLTDRYEEALEVWERLGKYIKIYYVSRIFVESNQMDNAAMAMGYAYNLRPDIYADAYANYQLDAGNILRDKADYSEADARYQAVITQFPNNARAYLELSMSQLRQGQPEGAINAADKAMEFGSTNVRHYFRVAQIYEQAGSTEKALLAYKKINSISPDNQEAMIEIERLRNQ